MADDVLQVVYSCDCATRAVEVAGSAWIGTGHELCLFCGLSVLTRVLLNGNDVCPGDASVQRLCQKPQDFPVFTPVTNTRPEG